MTTEAATNGEAPNGAVLRRRLRLGMVGGGRDAFIGAVHRIAARLDDRYELVAGAFSGDPQACGFPTVEDGVRGVKFIEAAVESNARGGVWVDARISI